MGTSVRGSGFDDLRRWTWPEEDRHLFTTAPWDGGFRWFRSGNVVCLEQFRHMRDARARSPSQKNPARHFGKNLHLIFIPCPPFTDQKY